MKVSLPDTTIVIFYRRDNELRERNLNLILEYYTNVIESPKIIVYQEVIDEKDVYQPTSSCVTVMSVIGDANAWNKSNAYNKCILAAETAVICFNDVDVIVDVDQLKQTEKILLREENKLILFPYDGRFLCVDEPLTKSFCIRMQSKDYTTNILKLYEPQDKKAMGRTDHIVTGHLRSVGGIVMSRKDTMLSINGYNPLFKGWGFEDNEVVNRAHKLGVVVGYLNIGSCWHFNHTDGDSSKKATQPFYKQNEELCNYISSMTKDQLSDTIMTLWKM